jgi:hypothetical protein
MKPMQDASMNKMPRVLSVEEVAGSIGIRKEESRL